MVNQRLTNYDIKENLKERKGKISKCLKHNALGL